MASFIVCFRDLAYFADLSIFLLKSFKVESIHQARSLEDAFDIGNFLKTDIILTEADFVSDFSRFEKEAAFSTLLILTDKKDWALEEEVINHTSIFTLRKPISNECLGQQIAFLLKEVKKMDRPSSGYHKKISRLLLEYGFNIKHKGFLYLKEAIYIKMTSSNMGSLSGRVYPSIASKHKVSDKSVERAIRQAVKYAWKEENLSFLKEEGMDMEEILKPTNLSLINYLADKVMDEMDELEASRW